MGTDSEAEDNDRLANETSRSSKGAGKSRTSKEGETSVAERLAIPPSSERRLESPYDRRVRERAAQKEAESGAPVMAEELPSILRILDLEESDDSLYEEALDYLSMLNAETITLHASAIAAKLRHLSTTSASARMCQRALLVLEKLDVNTLIEHATAIVVHLEHQDRQVRDTAARILGKIESEDLVEALSSSSPATIAKVFATRSPQEANAAMEFAKSQDNYAFVRVLVDLVLYDNPPYNAKVPARSEGLRPVRVSKAAPRTDTATTYTPVATPDRAASTVERLVDGIDREIDDFFGATNEDRVGDQLP